VIKISFSPEFQLSAACATWPPSETLSERVRQLADKGINWDEFIRIVTRHRVAGLIHASLHRAAVIIPEKAADQIRAQAAAIVSQNLAYVREAVRILRLFDQTQLPAVLLKGNVLSVLAYGNLAFRHSKDLDIVIFPGAITTASALLERAGYRRLTPPPHFNKAQLQSWFARCKELRFIHIERGFEVELHCRLFDNPFLMSHPPAQSWRRVTVSRGIDLPTFSEDDLFSYLCAHGASHCWFRLKWLADIAALLSQQSTSGIEHLYQAAKTRGVGRCAAQAIVLCRHIFGTTISDQFVEALCEDKATRWLTIAGTNAMTAAAPAESVFRGSRNDLSHFFFSSDRRYLFAEMRAHLLSPVDILTLPLPRKLQILYPLLRLPMWLWRHFHRI
jgi:hypothetical protein